MRKGPHVGTTVGAQGLRALRNRVEADEKPPNGVEPVHFLSSRFLAENHCDLWQHPPIWNIKLRIMRRGHGT